jgi:hypothetical protein
LSNAEFGMRPPASPSCRLYEPEAIGAYAYAPAGMRKKIEGEGIENKKVRKSEDKKIRKG